MFLHLWNNGTPHRKREKRAWEIEQEKKWSTVLSKSAKRQAKAKTKADAKRIHFAKPIVQQHSHILQFGSFSSYCLRKSRPSDQLLWFQSNSGAACSSARPNTASASGDFGSDWRPNSILKSKVQSVTPDPNMQRYTTSGDFCSDGPNPMHADSANQDCLPSPGSTPENVPAPVVLPRVHSVSMCQSQIRCKRCRNYGLVMGKCLTRALPRLVWMPKKD